MTTYAPPLTQQELFWGYFGERFRVARVAAGLTMDELAERTDLSVGQLWRYQQNRDRPRINSIVRICRVLGICPSALFPPLEEWHRG